MTAACQARDRVTINSTKQIMTALGTIRIGISGWAYASWRGSFYPKGLPQKQELAYAASRFPSIEIDGTFYRLQRPESFARWKDETPEDFVFAIKGSRSITHLHRLRNIETPLANFMASGLLRLGPKLGPILWQFPPQMAFDAELFQAFLILLPRDTKEAVALARRHDSWLADRCWLKSDTEQPLRHAVEIRNKSFLVPSFIELLRRYETALVCADSTEWPMLMDLTADFVYCRLHGSEKLYASEYNEEALDRWAERAHAWVRGGEPNDAERILGPAKKLGRGRDVFIFFDNTSESHAPEDAIALMQRLDISWLVKKEPSSLSELR